MKIAIVGGGPIGCYAGYKLASLGHDVEIYENHASIGSPIQCTGILTSDFDQFGFDVESFLVNIIDKIEVNSPNDSLVVKQKDYIVCRTKFDSFMADLAQSRGAKVFLSHPFIRKEGKELIVRDLKADSEKKVSYDVVIGADGPLSPTAKAFGFYEPSRVNYFGVQAVVKGEFDPSMIKTYFGNSVCPGLFVWVTPESGESARVGLAMKKNSKRYFEKFMKDQGFEASFMQAGTIPVYNARQKLYKDNCYLVGDASTYVKATTLGGIVPAMRQVDVLVDCLENGKDYAKEIKKVRREMWTHLRIAKAFEKFSDKDWDNLVRYVKQEKIQRVFEKYTRDNPIPLVLGSLVKEPRFLRFLKHV